MSMRWELAPYSSPWPDSGKWSESSGRFRSSWDQTLRLLADETDRLDAGLIVFEVDTSAEALRRDRQGWRDQRGPATAGVRVCFDSKNGLQRYATCRYSTWRANVHAVALSLQMLRAVDRYGVSSGEQYVGFRPALEAALRIPVFDSPRAAIRWMLDSLRDTGDYEGGAPDQVYKRLAKLWHPDSTVADAAAWAKLQAAKELLEAGGVL